MFSCNLYLVQEKEMALIVHQETLYFTRCKKHPVTTLIEGIWTKDPENARAITRNRIYTHLPLTPACEGMLKVAAKRVSTVGSAEYDALLSEWKMSKTAVEIPEIKPTLRTLPFSFESCTASEVAKLSKLNIGAVLLDENNKVVSWGWNDHFPNKIIHAEIMLVKNFQARTGIAKIPANYRLISTLQPCAMCAGYLYEHCDDFKSLKIEYEKEDPGPFAQNSILVPGSQLFKKCFS